MPKSAKVIMQSALDKYSRGDVSQGKDELDQASVQALLDILDVLKEIEQDLAAIGGSVSTMIPTASEKIALAAKPAAPKKPAPNDVKGS